MKKSTWLVRLAALALVHCSLAPSASATTAPYAAAVVDYHPGTSSSLTNPFACLLRPGAVVGEGSGFDAVYGVFNPHYESSHITQIGAGGSLTLRLGCSATIATGVTEIGIFTNVSLVDSDYPNGTFSTASTFGADTVEVDVSADGVSWISLGQVLCEFPSTSFTDTPSPYHPTIDGLTQASFDQPHSLQLSDLVGKSHTQILELLNGSAGGTWIDLSPSGLDRVSHIRLRVPADGEPFELAALAINQAVAGSEPTGLAFREDFSSDPTGTTAFTTGDSDSVTYTPGAMTFDFDLANAPFRTCWPLGQTLTDDDSFSYRAEFTINALSFSESNFGQLSFGLLNATTTGSVRTTAPSDTWDLLTVDYFPNEQFATLAPTTIGSQQPGQTNAFDNLRFPDGPASLINDFDEIQQLPIGTQLSVSVDYDATSRLVTLRVADQAINADFTNTDNDVNTIQYTIPEEIDFSLDCFAIICWEESSGGTANLTFTHIEASTTGPAPNYYTWAERQISAGHSPLELAPELDADADGLSNLLEYALDETPPTTSVTTDSLSLTWQQNPNRTDVTITAQQSPDLKTWSPVNSIGTDEKSASVGITTDRKFLRLKATRP